MSEFVSATLYSRNYVIDPIHGSFQSVKEIFIPSIKATINYATDFFDKQLNVCSCERLPSTSPNGINITNQSEPILDHTEIKLSKEFVDLIKELLKKQTEIQTIESDIIKMDESLFLGVNKSN